MESIISSLPPLFGFLVAIMYFIIQDRKRSSQESANHGETMDAILSLKESVIESKGDIKALEKRVDELERDMEQEICSIKETIARLRAMNNG